MPRKRKYTDPAGSTAGEAAALPPSTQTQPEPKYSRTRRPGDKWLKTATDHSSHGGFRYESVRDARCYPSRSSSPVSDRGSPSDDGLLPESEIQQQSQLLSPGSRSLCCWESSSAIRKGAEFGDYDKSWKSVYSFISVPASTCAASCSPQRGERAGGEEHQASPSVKRWQWWWYQPHAAGLSTEESESDRSAGLRSSQDTASMLDTDDSRGSFASEKSAPEHGLLGPALVEPGSQRQGILVKTEDGSGRRFMPYPLPAAVGGAPADRGHLTAADGRVVEVRRVHPPAGSPQPQARAPGGGPGSPAANCRGVVQGKVRAPQSAGASAAEAAAGRAKRVWRRWDPSEEQALREAVDLLGTKDWAAIHDRMRTDRSIKQVR